MKNSENYIQATVHQWLWNEFPATRWLCYAIPNGGYRPGAAGATLKATGLVAGIPDYHIAIASTPYNGLYIEFKTPDANLNTEHVKHQMFVHTRLKAAKNKVIVCNDINKAKEEIIEYLKPTGYLNKEIQTKL